MLLGLRLLADKVAGLPVHLLQPWFSQDLRTLADSLERRLSRAVEDLEGAWVQVGGAGLCAPTWIGEVVDIRHRDTGL